MLQEAESNLEGIALLLLFLAVLLTPGFPRRCVQIFTFLFGPAAGTPAWEIIHATGQKIIVAASILTGLIQVLIVKDHLK